jgi:predicted ATP-grasp superfamily ATP-dependent carboligase
VRAFITDGAERPALAITRSLGRRGVAVFAGAERTVSLASSSRYCRRHVTYPSPYRDTRLFLRFLIDVVERHRIDVLIPVSEVTTSVIAQNRDAFRGCAVAAPPFEAFDFVSDKGKLLKRAVACGIPIPRTEFVDDGTNVAALAARIDYPAVVKPVRSRIRGSAGWTPTSVRYAHSAADLVRMYRETDYLRAHPSMIQERIVGTGLGVFVLCDRGQLRAAFAHRRLRERPPSGGVSVLCESAALEPRLLQQAMQLLAPIGWHGVAMLEYKEDQRTGQPVLMEVNGRFWGSLQLAIDAGIDFPYLAYQLALGRTPDPSPYQVGVRSRWLLGDLDQLYLRLFRGGRDLPATASSPSAAIIDFFKGFSPRVKSEVRIDDLGPLFCELAGYTNALWRSGVHRTRRRIAHLASRLQLGVAGVSSHPRSTRNQPLSQQDVEKRILHG